MALKLHIVVEMPSQELQVSDLVFQKDRISIGRANSNDVHLDLKTVSRKHALIWKDKGDWLIEDLGSTHGTWVNGESLQEIGKKLLKSGDLIGIASAKITFLIESDVPEDIPEESTSVVARQLVKDALLELEKGADVPYLRLMNGPAEGTKVEIPPNRQELYIGRSAECALRLDDGGVSRKHAKISRQWDAISIEDLQSKNGVLVNEVSIKEKTLLKDGDEIKIASFRLTFVDLAARTFQGLEEQEKPEEAPSVKKVAVPSPPPLSSPSPPPVEAAASKVEPLSPKRGIRLGIVEIILIGLATVVVVGVGVGIMLLNTYR